MQPEPGLSYCRDTGLNLETYNNHCASLPATTHVVQWGGAHVWKVGGKVFAIAGWSDGEMPHIVFKTTELGFDIMKDQAGMRPAPYLARRGGKWIQIHQEDALSDDETRNYLTESHRLVSLTLTKKLQRELGLA